jgi:hypothetical protein
VAAAELRSCADGVAAAVGRENSGELGAGGTAQPVRIMAAAVVASLALTHS